LKYNKTPLRTITVQLNIHHIKQFGTVDTVNQFKTRYIIVFHIYFGL